jgi:hypothetical protein
MLLNIRFDIFLADYYLLTNGIGSGLSTNSRRRRAIALLLVYYPCPTRARIKEWVVG